MNSGFAFENRRSAGRAVARALQSYAGQSGIVVLALPRGGVPVAYEVANALRAPLDVFAVRKLGVPGHEELAMGAVASGGITVIDARVVGMMGLQPADIARVKERELEELRRRERAYRDDRPRPPLTGKTVIVVDDGLATGSSMRAAVEAVRQNSPARVIVAVPVGSAQTCERLEYLADDVVCVLTPPDFHAVGAHYLDFRQTTDEEVRELLDLAAANGPTWTAA